MHALFLEGGEKAWRKVMEEKLVAFLQALSALVPKEFTADEETVGGFLQVWAAIAQLGKQKSQED
jgi:hypothetical protein